MAKYIWMKLFLDSLRFIFPFAIKSLCFIMLWPYFLTITNLSDCKWTRTHNHLVFKRTLNHLAKLGKWLSCVLSTYLYGEFDCMFLSCHVRVSEWIHTLGLLECQGSPCSKQARNLKIRKRNIAEKEKHIEHALHMLKSMANKISGNTDFSEKM